MRKTVSIFLGFAVLLFVGCDTADKQIPEMATDFCNCFADLEKNLSSTTKGIWQKAANARDPQSTMRTELEKLSAEDKEKVKGEINVSIVLPSTERYCAPKSFCGTSNARGSIVPSGRRRRSPLLAAVYCFVFCKITSIS